MTARIPGTVVVDHAIVGVSDLEASKSFFEAFGFAEQDRRSLDPSVAQSLYGIDTADELVMGVPGAETGQLRLISTPLPTPDRGHFHRGGHALDIYTTDIHRSVGIAEENGYVVGPVADYTFGPVHLQQAQTMGPDDVPLVFVGIDRRLPSVLETAPERLHSELHSIVGCIDDIDAETAFWTDVVGLDLKSQFPIDVPAVSEFMMLPRHAPIKMSVLSGPAVNPPRFELLAFNDADGKSIAGRPLAPGCLVVGLRVDDVSAALQALAARGADTYSLVEAVGINGQREHAAFATTPGGLDLEIRGPLEA